MQGLLKAMIDEFGVDQKIYEQVHVGRVVTRVCGVQNIKALQKIIIENLKLKAL